MDSGQMAVEWESRLCPRGGAGATRRDSCFRYPAAKANYSPNAQRSILNRFFYFFLGVAVLSYVLRREHALAPIWQDTSTALV